jgi:cytochrome c oxidase subunit 4
MADAHTHEDVARHVRVYLTIGAALLMGTLLTVAMYYVHFEAFAVTVTVALIIATVKAGLVAGYFMHLISEKVMIYTVLVFTVFFFAAMMALFIWSVFDLPDLSSFRYVT